MNAGRELDALVAEKVMGWGPIRIDRNGNHCGLNPSFPDRPPIHIIPHYSTDIASAWDVIEKIRVHENFVKFNLSGPNPETEDGYFASFCIGHGVQTAFSRFGPHAICLAALKALK